MHQPEDIAECMLRLVEEERYGGGTVMQKSPGVEQVVFDLASQTRIADGVVAAPDASHVKSIMDKERGSGWKG